MKRCGKSAPAVRVTGLARQTPPGARPSRKQCGEFSPSRVCPARSRLPGRSHEAAGNRRPREMATLDRTRLTGPLQLFLWHGFGFNQSAASRRLAFEDLEVDKCGCIFD